MVMDSERMARGERLGAIIELAGMDAAMVAELADVQPERLAMALTGMGDLETGELGCIGEAIGVRADFIATTPVEWSLERRKVKDGRADDGSDAYHYQATLRRMESARKARR